MTRSPKTATACLLALLVSFGFSFAVPAASANNTADECRAIDHAYILQNGEMAEECATSAWDASGDIDCLPVFYSESDGEATCGTGSTTTRGDDSSKCGAGWAQAWRVKVELHKGDAEVTGAIACNGKTKAECLIQIGGTKVCTDDGGSERGPIDCAGEVGEVVQRPVEGILKCTDPLNAEAFIVVAFRFVDVNGTLQF